VHFEQACRHSPVLRAAFNSKFLEGQSQRYKLDDTSAGAVQLLVQWMYSESIDISLGELPTANNNMWPSKSKQDDSLAKAWVLADRLLMPKMQNHVMNQMGQVCKHYKLIPSLTFEYIWNNTATGSPLRLRVLDWCAHIVNPDSFLKAGAQFPKQLLLELVTQYAGDPAFKAYKSGKVKNETINKYEVPTEPEG